MSEEVELKLLVSPNNDIPLQELPPVKAVERLTFPLINRYFDTADHRLNKAGIALRLRYQHGQWLQTLKAKGTPRGGLHQRNEWEMPVAGEQLELSRFPDDVLPEGVTQNNLEVMFETNFDRSQWQLKRENAQVELVLDTGAAIAGDRESKICEIELELKSGEPVALFELATELAAHIPLVPSDISKAERGFSVMQDTRHWPGVPDQSASTGEWLSAVCRQLEALPQSSTDLARSLQGLAQRSQDQGGHLGIVQSVTAGLAADAGHWSDLPEVRALGAWLVAESRQDWARKKQ